MTSQQVVNFRIGKIGFQFGYNDEREIMGPLQSATHKKPPFNVYSGNSYNCSEANNLIYWPI